MQNVFQLHDFNQVHLDFPLLSGVKTLIRGQFRKLSAHLI